MVYMKKATREVLKEYEERNKSGLIRFLNNHDEMREDLMKQYDPGTSLPEAVWMFYARVKHAPACPYCGKACKFNSLSRGFFNTCGSSSCKSLSYSESGKNGRAKNGSYANVGRKKRKKENGAQDTQTSVA